VLDVCTAEGGFIHALVEHLESYAQIIGIDTNLDALRVAQRAFDREGIDFVQMDAEHMAFRDESLDTVNLSFSLHHLAHLPRVLRQMKRVLVPGGHAIISEMHRDGQTEAQLLAARIHQWAAEVDSALGTTHHRTHTRQEIVDHVGALDLSHVAFYEFIDVDSDPTDTAAIEGVRGYIDRFMLRLRGASTGGALEQHGEELRRQLYQVGFQREPVLVAVGKKR
jgi:SAM-dependent methyltransferase